MSLWEPLADALKRGRWNDGMTSEQRRQHYAKQINAAKRLAERLRRKDAR